MNERLDKKEVGNTLSRIDAHVEAQVDQAMRRICTERALVTGADSNVPYSYRLTAGQ